jgi:tetratricopeptide (TPR) repeat protein
MRLQTYPGPKALLFLLVTLAFSCQTDRNGRSNREADRGSQAISEQIITARTMGLAFLEENKLEEAEAQFLELIELAPEEAIGYANLGLVYLRMGRYDDAESNLLEALDKTPLDADIRFNLASVYNYKNQNEDFLRELERAISDQPDHAQSIYRLAEYFGGRGDAESIQKRERYLKQALEVVPANIVPRLHLIESLIASGKRDEAIGQLEEVRRIFPEFSGEAMDHYELSLSALQSGKMEEALTNVLIFHNFLKLTNPYNQGVTELQGFQGASMGKPVFAFSEATTLFVSDGESILDALKFTDVTELAGLSQFGGGAEGQRDPLKGRATHIATGDFDHDGIEDLYVGAYASSGDAYGQFLLKAELGRFNDVTPGTGIKSRGEESQALFADYDNDGWFDLLLLAGGQPVLYQSISQGKYKDVSRQAFPDMPSDAVSALYVDMDHEGDLDLFLSTTGTNRLYRNNADGTFTDFTKESGLAGSPNGSYESCFGDFDDDGDIDLFTVNREAPCQLFSNLREGRFREVTEASGLGNLTDKQMVTAGDYNNDGYLDLFVAGEATGTFQCLRNTGRGTFETGPSLTGISEVSEQFRALDARFFDFDNDGYLDLLIVGDPGDSGQSGAVLFHNNREGGFENVSRLLPERFEGGRQISVSDYNDDGDLDIFLAGLNGGAKLLRNDGGNANRRLKMRLVGVRSGSGKNNYYGIGAKVELRAGNLYQMKQVTEPNIYFGLADRSDVDVVRILWTNGTPQNIFNPGIEQALIEEQQLKGSCPFLYTWDGDSYTFVKDIMWRSALGMPMGIMGEEQSYAFADASRDYHKIPGHLLRPKDGRYVIQITEELWETIYLDEVQLLVVDHPDSIDIYIDEKFVPPPYPPLEIHTVPRYAKIYASEAYNREGREVSGLLREKDDRFVSGFSKGRYQGITEMSELILDPGRLPDTGHIYLYLTGWIFPTDASINLALSQGENEKVSAPSLQVINSEGKWETVIESIGFPQGKDKTIIVDLSGLLPTSDHRVRIRTNMEIYWDQAFFSAGNSDLPVNTMRLMPVAADHHFRGFSELYRKGGRYGPHWFNYETVSEGPRWRDLTGYYTRYGDVLELLMAPDNMYIIANAGDETTIEFDAGEAPPIPDGWSRDFLIYTTGWVKDGDMNTAEGNRVMPLPFHGMKRYPYGAGESYPDSPQLKSYHQTYNTREVDDRKFRREVAEMK